MILRTLELRHYGPFAGPHRVELRPPQPAGPGNIGVVLAPNGSGKTSLFEAMLVALYGVRAPLASRAAQSWPQWLRAARNTAAPAQEPSEVGLVLDLVDAAGVEPLRIVRAWRPRESGVAEELRVERLGADGAWRPDAEATAEWPARMEAVLPAALASLFFQDGEQIRGLAQHETPIPEVREAIHTLLGLDLPQRLRQDLGLIAARRQRERVAPAHTEGLRALERALEQQQAACAAARARVAELGAALAEADAALRLAAARAATQGADLSARRGELEQTRAQAEAEVKQLRRELGALAAGPLPLVLVQAELRRALAYTQAELDAEDRRLAARFIKQRDAEVLRHLEDLDAGAVLLRALKKRLETSELPPRSIHAPLGLTWEERRIAMDLQGGLEGLSARARALSEALTAAQERVLSLDTLLGQAAPEEQAAGLLGELRDRAEARGALAWKLAEAQEQLGAQEAEVSRLSRALSQQLEALAAQSAEAQTEARVLAAVERVSGVLTAYSARLRAVKLARMEEHITERIRLLARKSPWITRVRMDPDSYALTLYSPDGHTIDRARLSAGEQQLLAVAQLWALGTASGRCLPVVVDTPLGRLDSTHRGTLLRHYFPFASHQVVLLSTDTELEAPALAGLRASGALGWCQRIEHDAHTRSSRVVVGDSGSGPCDRR